MSDGVAENDRQREFPVRDDGGTEAELGANVDDAMETILNDPRRKAALLQRMGLDEPSDPGRRDSYQSHLTPSGKSTGGWSYPPGPLWPFPPMPYAGYPVHLEMGWPGNYRGRSPGVSSASSAPTPEDAPGPSTSTAFTRKRTCSAREEEDTIDMLDDAEALELIEFDASVEPRDSWDPPSSMASFLKKHSTDHWGRMRKRPS